MRRILCAVLLVTAGCASQGAALDPRLAPGYLDRLRPGVSRESDARELLGPPERVQSFPRMERTAWSYPVQGIQPQLIVVQFSPDGIAREVYVIEDPDAISSE